MTTLKTFSRRITRLLGKKIGPAKLEYRYRDYSILVVVPKPRFIELVNAANLRRFKRVYGPPGGEDSMVWMIPNIDLLGSKAGSYTNYIKRLKVPIVKYELATFGVGREELSAEPTEELCDELFDLQVYAGLFPIEMLLKMACT